MRPLDGASDKTQLISWIKLIQCVIPNLRQVDVTERLALGWGGVEGHKVNHPFRWLNAAQKRRFASLLKMVWLNPRHRLNRLCWLGWGGIKWGFNPQV